MVGTRYLMLLHGKRDVYMIGRDNTVCEFYYLVMTVTTLLFDVTNPATMTSLTPLL